MSNQIMSNDEYVKRLALAVEKYKSEFEGIYILNAENFSKFQKVHSYLLELAKDSDGKIVYCDIDPKNVHGGISIKLPMLDLYKYKLDKFKEILELVDVFGADARTDGDIQIDFSVSYVWKAVPRK